MRFVPKGAMCLACVNLKKDCSRLPFSRMPAIIEVDGVTTVICTEFRRSLPPVPPAKKANACPHAPSAEISP